MASIVRDAQGLTGSIKVWPEPSTTCPPPHSLTPTTAPGTGCLPTSWRPRIGPSRRPPSSTSTCAPPPPFPSPPLPSSMKSLRPFRGGQGSAQTDHHLSYKARRISHAAGGHHEAAAVLMTAVLVSVLAAESSTRSVALCTSSGTSSGHSSDILVASPPTFSASGDRSGSSSRTHSVDSDDRVVTQSVTIRHLSRVLIGQDTSVGCF